MKWLDSITDSMDMSEQALGVGDGQGSLACYSPWGHKELDTTERLTHTHTHQKQGDRPLFTYSPVAKATLEAEI